MIPFPPRNIPEAIILVGLVASAIMYVLIPAAIPVGYGVRGLWRKARPTDRIRSARQKLEDRNEKILHEREARRG